ncbi:hypothetical protein ElyMa_004947100 [Elysia marginata]|uniref:Uncharacterized protein n=1 Tax=Elysia marginata TaxID=1093978 RepID=A0AAV4IZP6_9GAST|nr:hypothetical protein ElyMa_004947100 [Elysia marginata]
MEDAYVMSKCDKLTEGPYVMPSQDGRMEDAYVMSRCDEQTEDPYVMPSQDGRMEDAYVMPRPDEQTAGLYIDMPRCQEIRETIIVLPRLKEEKEGACKLPDLAEERDCFNRKFEQSDLVYKNLVGLHADLKDNTRSMSWQEIRDVSITNKELRHAESEYVNVSQPEGVYVRSFPKANEDIQNVEAKLVQ